MAHRVWRLAVLGCVAVLLGASAASAQEQPAQNPLAPLDWVSGPTSGKLGDVASIVVPDGYRFVGRGQARKFMELTENPSDGSELGVLLSPNGWFVVFDFSADGYVKDDDRDLDADAFSHRLGKARRRRTKSADREVGEPWRLWAGNSRPFMTPQPTI